MLCPFFNWVICVFFIVEFVFFIYLWVFFVFFCFFIYSGYTIYILNTVFSLSWWCYLKHKFFKIWWSQMYPFFLLFLMLLVSYLRIHCLIQCHENLWLCFLLRVLYRIISFASKNSFSFPIWITFISFSCLIALARNSNIMLNRSVKSKHPYLVPDLRGKRSSLSPLSLMLTVGFW